MTPTALASRRRRAARIALYSSLVLVGGVTYSLVKFLDRPLKAQRTEEWAKLDYAGMPEVKLLQQYAQIDTSETTGNGQKRTFGKQLTNDPSAHGSQRGAH